MSKALVRDLLDGSEVIDIRKKHIHTILNMLFWLVKPEEIRGVMRAASYSSLKFESGSKMWFLTKSGRSAFGIELNYLSGGAIMLPIYQTKSHALVSPSYDKVSVVFESLPILVDGFATTFPQLEERWRPFLEAAPPR